ncbi:MAG: aminotransferase [Rhodobacterales bacterium]|nr:MAG: aminotransferase [Rhodobacterales bacterium]
MTAPLFDRFRNTLTTKDPVSDIRSGLIGKGLEIPGTAGPRKMIYADYVASGRPLRQIEEFVLTEILPYYANSHTEDSFVGAAVTAMRAQAKDVIRDLCGAGPEHAVIFTGSGATHGLNRLVHLLGADDPSSNPVVLTGPYEHHSNILPWRESGAEVIAIPEADSGGPCLRALDAALARTKGRRVIGAFSAASNVSGIVTDVTEVTRRLKAAGAAAVWDYAGGGPYLPIAMTPADGVEIDAIVLSPHKFVGGPQASGVLIMRRDAVRSTRPTFPGGGTVVFVSPTAHDYIPDVEAREEAGTPNVVGDLRAALVMIVKDVIGQAFITRRNAELRDRALRAWSGQDRIQILGRTDCPRLPIFSFEIADGSGGHICAQSFTRRLSDETGVQARAGCACAGPYGHQVLHIDPETSERIRREVQAGDVSNRPGFTRLNFSYLITDAEADEIIRAVTRLADTPTPKRSAWTRLFRRRAA